jgi:hypothetical protein
MAQRYPERAERAAREAVTRWRLGRGRGGVVEKKKLTSGVHASTREEREGVVDGRRESKKKTYFCKYANSARGLSGLGRPVGEERKKNLRIKIGFFEFSKALEICRRRFRRNFDIRIFPKFF